MNPSFFSHHAHHRDDDGKPFYRRTRFWWWVLIALIILILVRHCSNSFKKSKSAPAVSVVVGQAQTANVPVYLQGLGTVTPLNSITVKTLINGLLLQVLFTEGQIVKKGQLLAQIDPRPYEALLAQYEGQLVRDQALLDNANVDLQRYQLLWKQNSVAKQTLDTQVSLVKQDTGTVQIDQGLIQATKLNIYYTKIASPVDGRIGLRLVDPGNYVQTSDTAGIAVIDTIQPITVVFTLPEDDVQKVLQQTNAGKVLQTEVYNRMQNKLLATGQLLTMDNQVDPTTGTVKLKAVFQNEKNLLFSGEFVNIKLLVNTLQNAVIVPTSAIQYSPQGTFVYLVDIKKSTVSVHPVTVGLTNGDDTVITTGLSAGQTVVTEGVDKLTDGAAIEIPKATDTANAKKKVESKTAIAFGPHHRRLIA